MTAIWPASLGRVQRGGQAPMMRRCHACYPLYNDRQATISVCLSFVQPSFFTHFSRISQRNVSGDPDREGGEGGEGGRGVKGKNKLFPISSAR